MDDEIWPICENFLAKSATVLTGFAISTCWNWTKLLLIDSFLILPAGSARSFSLTTISAFFSMLVLPVPLSVPSANEERGVSELTTGLASTLTAEQARRVGVTRLRRGTLLLVGPILNEDCGEMSVDETKPFVAKIVAGECRKTPPGLEVTPSTLSDETLVAKVIGSVRGCCCGVEGWESDGELNTALGAGSSSLIIDFVGVDRCFAAATKLAAIPFKKAEAEVTTGDEDCDDNGADGVLDFGAPTDPISMELLPRFW